jgi:hypothetical protein
MTQHRDPYKMTTPELEACGCERCQDAIRLSGMLDKMIASQNESIKALNRLDAAITNLEDTMRA